MKKHLEMLIQHYSKVYEELIPMSFHEQMVYLDKTDTDLGICYCLAHHFFVPSEESTWIAEYKPKDRKNSSYWYPIPVNASNSAEILESISWRLNYLKEIYERTNSSSD